MGYRVSTLVLGAAALALVAAALTGASLPFLAGDRSTLLALAVLGMAMCGGGPLSTVAATGKWLSAASIGGILLGSASLALVLAVALDRRPSPIADDRTALLVLAALIAVKLGLGLLHRLAAGRYLPVAAAAPSSTKR